MTPATLLETIASELASIRAALGLVTVPPTPDDPAYVRVTEQVPVGGGSGLTDTELRAVAVPVSLASVPAHAVTGTFWQATQPVSLAGSVAVTGAFFQATQPVSIAAMPTTAVTGPLTDAQLRAAGVPVTGTFFQATQPVSGPLTDAQLRATRVPVELPPGGTGLTDTELRATAVPVSGTFYPATQAVSIAASVAVTGAFFQATQPVSIASMPTTAVTGTFWQATQPVSLAGSVAVTGPLTDAEIRATALPVSGTFFQATQPVSIASMPTTPVTGTFWQATQPVSLTSTTITGSVAVTGPLTDTQIRATPLPVSGTVAVTGTFWQATQPVSGPLTDTQLRATAVPVSLTSTTVTGSVAVTGTFWQATQPVSIASMPTTPVTGTFFQATQPVSLASVPTHGVTGTFWQATQPVSIAGTVNVSQAAGALFTGSACTFRIPGRAGTAGQKLMSIHNATGSAILVRVSKIAVSLMQTVVKAITVAPPVIRVWKVTVLPINGTAATKNKAGGTTTSSASVTVLGDASADGTGSATTLTATLPAGTIVEQQFADNVITAAGCVNNTEKTFLEDAPVVLQALEGLVVYLDYSLATQNPTSDMWLVSLAWDELNNA